MSVLQLPPLRPAASQCLAACHAGVDLGSHSAKVVLASVAAPRRVLAAARLVYDAPTAGDPLRQARAVADWLQNWTSHPVRSVSCSLAQSLTDYEASPLEGDAGAIDSVAAKKLESLLGGQASRVTADSWLTEAPGNRRSLHLLWASTDLATGVAREFDDHRMACRRLAAPPASLGMAAAEAVSGTHVVVDLGHNRTSIALVQGGQVAFARPRVGLSTSAAIKHLQEQLGVGRTAAETLAAGQGDIAAAGAVVGLVRKAFDQWLRDLQFELARTLSFVDGAELGPAPESVLLCGGGAAVRGVCDWLADRIELPVRRCPPPASAAWEAAEPYSPGFATAAALALTQEES